MNDLDEQLSGSNKESRATVQELPQNWVGNCVDRGAWQILYDLSE